jgi:AcrR family transcriptional regulator
MQEAARALITSEGIEALTSIRIAQEAGIPVGSVYAYFPNHLAIIEALADQWLATIRDGLQSLLQRPLSPDNWPALFDDMLQMVYGPPEKLPERRFENEMVKALEFFPELQSLRNAHAREAAQLLTEILIRAGAQGDRARLARLTRYCYELIGGLDNYLMQPEIQAGEALEWTRQILRQLLAPCFAAPVLLR